MIKGIFFSLSSFSAMCKGSISWGSRSTKTGAFLLICRALVPRILAFSYFVINGDVTLSWISSFESLAGSFVGLSISSWSFSGTWTDSSLFSYSREPWSLMYSSAEDIIKSSRL